jgi:hypothetical protein
MRASEREAQTDSLVSSERSAIGPRTWQREAQTEIERLRQRARECERASERRSAICGKESVRSIVPRGGGGCKEGRDTGREGGMDGGREGGKEGGRY